MSPLSELRPEGTIQGALEEFLQDRRRRLSDEDFRLYRHVTFFLELCVNNHGHRNLDAEERSRYERLYSGGTLLFFEVFGPEKLLPEMDFFTRSFLDREVHTSERVTRRAPEVIDSLRQWLVRTGKVSAAAVEEQARRAEIRVRLRTRLRRLERTMARGVLTADVATLPADDRVPLDDHPITRIQAGKIWLRVYDRASSREIGPLNVPPEAASRLRVGWSLCCALARVRGRWRILELQEIYPSFE